MSAFPPKCMDPPRVARENGEPGVRSCTNVSGLALELVLRTIMEIRAHPILLAAMPLRAISGVSSRMRREDQFSISSLSLAALGGETGGGVSGVCGQTEAFARCFNRPATKTTTAVKNGPGDASEFVGERNRQLEPIEPPGCSLDPGFETMLLPALRAQ